MFLFVGLGNKGLEYSKTRHNIGFMVIDGILENLNIKTSMVEKFSSLFTSFEFENQNILCIKPQTYMNLSGKSVLKTMQFYKIPISNVFVFYDDIETKLGKIKFKTGGGAGGHNGIRSIDSSIGTEYNRIKIGIGRPETGSVSDFVLSNFLTEELNIINKKTEELSFNLKNLLEKKLLNL